MALAALHDDDDIVSRHKQSRLWVQVRIQNPRPLPASRPPTRSAKNAPETSTALNSNFKSSADRRWSIATVDEAPTQLPLLLLRKFKQTELAAIIWCLDFFV